ncbi:MAG: hypothetical protein D6811_11635 [Alphaproteobacteria bacterium]|nr:MAG: hypothetical protein D6811_11635 [Alphaproteobacteria bacterium]
MKRIATAALGLWLAAGVGLPALAGQTHRVDMVGNALFPPAFAASVGDEVEFHNRGAESNTVVASDASWSVGPVEEGDTATITIEEGMTLSFRLSGVDMPDAEINLTTED